MSKVFDSSVRRQKFSIKSTIFLFCLRQGVGWFLWSWRGVLGNQVLSRQKHIWSCLWPSHLQTRVWKVAEGVECVPWQSDLRPVCHQGIQTRKKRTAVLHPSGVGKIGQRSWTQMAYGEITRVQRVSPQLSSV